jgi:hypothetical protein
MSYRSSFTEKEQPPSDGLIGTQWWLKAACKG